MFNRTLSVQMEEGIFLQALDFAALNLNFPFELNYVDIAPGVTTVMDQHEVAECWIILQGNGLLNYAGKLTRVYTHNILFFAPHQTHQISNDTNDWLRICSLYW